MQRSARRHRAAGHGAGQARLPSRARPARVRGQRPLRVRRPVQVRGIQVARRQGGRGGRTRGAAPALDGGEGAREAAYRRAHDGWERALGLAAGQASGAQQRLRQARLQHPAPGAGRGAGAAAARTGRCGLREARQRVLRPVRPARGGELRRARGETCRPRAPQGPAADRLRGAGHARRVREGALARARSGRRRGPHFVRLPAAARDHLRGSRRSGRAGRRHARQPALPGGQGAAAGLPGHERQPAGFDLALPGARLPARRPRRIGAGLAGEAPAAGETAGRAGGADREPERGQAALVPAGRAGRAALLVGLQRARRRARAAAERRGARQRGALARLLRTMRSVGALPRRRSEGHLPQVLHRVPEGRVPRQG